MFCGLVESLLRPLLLLDMPAGRALSLSEACFRLHLSLKRNVRPNNNGTLFRLSKGQVL